MPSVVTVTLAKYNTNKKKTVKKMRRDIKVCPPVKGFMF